MSIILYYYAKFAIEKVLLSRKLNKI